MTDKDTRQLRHVGTYHRSLPVAAERVVENALDWEHLPWLHRTSFASITKLDGGVDFWRARVTVRAVVDHDIVIELRFEASRRAYLTRTLEGAGAGTEVRTRITATGARTTEVDVEFHVAGPLRALGPVVGATYKRLYARLWDEDERMMLQRQAHLDHLASRGPRSAGDAGPHSMSLGDATKLRARLPLLVSTPRGELRVLELDGALCAHAATCPHLGGPLGTAPVEDGRIECPWHGYRFDVRTGAPASDHRCRLPPAPRVEVDAHSNEVRLVWAERAR